MEEIIYEGVDRMFIQDNMTRIDEHKERVQKIDRLGWRHFTQTKNKSKNKKK